MTTTAIDTNNKNDTGKPPTILGWMIRVASILIMASLAGFLIFKIAQPKRDISLTVEPIADEARVQNGQILLPIDITNDGTATIRAMDLELSAAGETHTVNITMLGHDETIRYVIDVPSKDSRVSHTIKAYEAP